MGVHVLKCHVCGADVYAFDESDPTIDEWKDGAVWCSEENVYYCKDHLPDCTLGEVHRCLCTEDPPPCDEVDLEDDETEDEDASGYCTLIDPDGEDEECPYPDLACEDCDYYEPAETDEQPLWDDDEDPDMEVDE